MLHLQIVISSARTLGAEKPPKKSKEARAPLTAGTALVLLVQQLETGQYSASTLVTAAQRAAQSCGHWERETKE